jgi:hypothetical protein
VNSPRPEHTRAVIVGIDAYAEGSGWNLDGSVADAARVATWLLDAHVPPDHITCVLGERDDLDTAQVAVVRDGGVAVQGDATRDALEKVFIDGLRAPGDLLVVFWSGHGVLLDEKDNRALLTGDATSDHKLNVRVLEILRHLQRETTGPFAQQLLLVDACANFVEQLGGPTPPLSTWPRTVRRETEQFVLFSAAQGQIAATGTRFQGFVGTALEFLQREGWPPDPPRLAQHVQDHFADLRDKGLARQKPVALWRRDAGEEDRFVTFGGQPVGAHAREGAAATGLTVAQVRRLAKVISTVPALATPAGGSAFLARLADLVPGQQQLPPTLGGASPDDLVDLVADVLSRTAAVGRADVLEPLTRALQGLGDSDEDRFAWESVQERWRLQVRVAPVMHALRAVGADQVRRAYYAVVLDRNLAPRPQELDDALEYLASQRWDGPPWRGPLLRFVGRLEAESGVRVDDGWFRLDPVKLTWLRTAAAEAGADGPAHLVICASPGVLGNARPLDTVAGHLQRDDGRWDVHRVRGGDSQAAMEQATCTLLDWAHDVEERKLTLGFLLPRTGFDLAPEEWMYSDSMAGPAPVGSDYPVVLHCGDRLTAPRPMAEWRRRAREIARQLQDAAPGVRWLANSDMTPRGRLRELLDSTACVGLRMPPGGTSGREDPLLSVLRWGVPYLIWYEGEGEQPDVVAAVEDVAARGGFDDLPLRLYELAIEQETAAPGMASPRPRIRVLWDSPRWLPPVEEGR